MTTDLMERLIFLAGLGQAGILIASALVPFQLKWREELRPLSLLHRQMYWVYGGYVVLSIVAFALLSLFNARELAGGGRLARGICVYIAVFWGIRLALQAVLDVEAHLTAWWLKAGYFALGLLFAGFTLVYALASLAVQLAGRAPRADGVNVARRRVSECCMIQIHMRSAASGLVSLLLLGVMPGCHLVPDREFAGLEGALTLVIADARRHASGGSVGVSFELTNRGSTSAKACLGPSRKASYEGSSASGGNLTLVDHPGCTREFALQPGGVMSWAETLVVPRLPQGRVDLQVDIQVVNPRRCGSWGNCAAFDLESNHFELQ